MAKMSLLFIVDWLLLFLLLFSSGTFMRKTRDSLFFPLVWNQFSHLLELLRSLSAPACVEERPDHGCSDLPGKLDTNSFAPGRIIGTSIAAERDGQLHPVNEMLV